MSSTPHNGDTPIQKCVREEMKRYFDMLNGEEVPCGLYRAIIDQVEDALYDAVLEACQGNQTRASRWLGISRGKLRDKLKNREPSS
ncbi:MAG: Fis family transcriptional regulator [Gammaproteobacteria bacterium]|nr:MAG: Fis family transcriptional regulator [Gammaproteobacteria bacterium]